MATQTRSRRAKAQEGAENGTAAKAAKEPAKEPDNRIRTKDVAEELGTTGVALRKVLRQYFYPDATFTVYVWDPASPSDMAELDEIKAKYRSLQVERAEKKEPKPKAERRPRAPRKAAVVAEADLEETDELEELDDEDEELDDDEEEEEENI